MSSTAPVVDVAEVLIRSVVNSKPVETGLFFRSHLGPVTQARLDLLVSRVTNAWRNNFSNVLGGPHVFVGVHAFDRSPGSTLTSEIILELSRGFGGDIMSNSIALRLLNLTDVPISRRKSSNFIYAIPEAKVNEGVIDNDYALALLSLWATNNQSHGPFGWHHVAVSFFAFGVPRSQGLVERVTHYSLAPLNPAAQRGRLENRFL